MQPKRILYIVTQAEWGGAQKYVFDLSKSFTEQNIKVGVVAGIEKTDLFINLGKIESDNLTPFRVSHLIRAINPYHDFIAFFQIIKIIRKFKPDIVHLNSSKAGILGTMAVVIYNFIKNPFFKKGGTNVKVIYTAHGFVFNEDLPILVYLFYLWSEKISSWFRDKIITVSHYDFKSALLKKVIKANKMTVIHNGIDIKQKDFLLSKVEARGKLKEFMSSGEFAVEDAEKLSQPETQIIGTVANFYENKGLQYLIESAAIVVKDMPNCIFILIGTGELKNKLKKLIKDNRLQNKFFIAGSILDAHKYLKAYDVFCLPSIKEGLSYTLIESLMAGLPIIATNVGGNPEIVKNGQNGFLIPSKDRRILAEKIKVLLKNDKLRLEMGRASFRMAENFSLEKMASKTMEVYEEILNSK
ncbi:glycosyltransferase family 4 protein [Patescibacteria group bacterium]